MKDRLFAGLTLLCAVCAYFTFSARVSVVHGIIAAFLVLSSGGMAMQMSRPVLGIMGVQYNVQLTNFAHGIAPDYTNALAEIMAPQCVAPASAGQYVAFNDDDAFRYVETLRALGGKGARIQLQSSSPKFDCSPHALEIPTDVFEFEKVGDAGVPMLRESKVRTLVSRSALSREYRVYKAYEDGTTAEGGLGSWTDDDKDPIAELNSIIVALARNTGGAKIHMVIAIDVLQQLGKHPKVLARFPGAQIINVTADVMQKLLLIPVQVHVGMMPIALEKVGKAAAKTFIGTGKVYAFLSQPNPSPFDPSAAKTFTTRLGQVAGVGTYEEKPFAEINFMSWSEDIRITGAACVKRIDVTLGDVVID